MKTDVCSDGFLSTDPGIKQNSPDGLQRSLLLVLTHVGLSQGPLSCPLCFSSSAFISATAQSTCYSGEAMIQRLLKRKFGWQMSRRNRLETTLTTSLCKSVPRQTSVMVMGWFQEMCYVHRFCAIIKTLRMNMPHGEVTYTHPGLYVDALLEVLPLDWRHLNRWTLTTSSAGQQDPLSLCSRWTGTVIAPGVGMDLDAVPTYLHWLYPDTRSFTTSSHTVPLVQTPCPVQDAMPTLHTFQGGFVPMSSSLVPWAVFVAGMH